MNIEEELKKLKEQHQDLLNKFELIRTNIIRVEGVMGFLKGKLIEAKKLKEKEDNHE